MPLSDSALSDDFVKSFQAQLDKSDGSVVYPKITDALAAALGADYDKYAKTAKTTAGSQTDPTGGSASDISGALTGDSWMDGWEAGVKAYWGKTKFTASATKETPGPADPSAISDIKKGIRALLADPAGTAAETTGMSIKDFCDKLAKILHDDTKKVTIKTVSKPDPTKPPPVPKDAIS